MCGLAAYIGPDIRLDQFLLAPPYGLLTRALTPRELPYPAANGFGIGWYGTDDTPAIYVNFLPIWSDVNLPHLGRSLYSNVWLAAVHGATRPFTLNSAAIIQPFYDNKLLFLHDGVLDGFEGLRRTIRDFLDPDIETEVRGNTDSEYLFALLRHLLAGEVDLSIGDALAEMFALLEEWLEERTGLLNIVVSDGIRIYAARHAVNTECRALYYNIDDELFPEAQLLAAERLTEAEFWQPVPAHHLLILDAEAPPQLRAL